MHSLQISHEAHDLSKVFVHSYVLSLSLSLPLCTLQTLVLTDDSFRGRKELKHRALEFPNVNIKERFMRIFPKTLPLILQI